MSEGKKWTDRAISAKAEWEGLDYLFTDVDPDEVEDEELADWIRVGRVAFDNVHRIIERMAEETAEADFMVVLRRARVALSQRQKEGSSRAR